MGLGPNSVEIKLIRLNKGREKPLPKVTVTAESKE